MLEFSVQDSGIGIDAKDFQAIFAPFEQIDGSATRKFGGTGLGLSLTKSMVELLGGRIWVESTSGTGACFRFILPAKHTNDNDTVNAESPPTKEEQATAAVQIEAGKKIVLLIDGDEEFYYIIQKFLGKEKYCFIHARSGEAGLRLAEEHNPDVVLLEVMLSKMDGWEVLQKLKKNEKTEHIPVIISSVVDNKRLGFSLGASDFFVKPVDKSLFIRHVEKICQDRKLRKILIVDDDLSQAELVEEILDSDDFISEVATNGGTALQLIQQKTYDLVILDLLMPQMDGFAVLHSLNENPGKIPVLVLTGKVLSKEEQTILSGKYCRIFRKACFHAKNSSMKSTIFCGRPSLLRHV